jgi:peptidoglycan/xylan/chitin deacetylase (PgdA/CDA1 family)
VANGDAGWRWGASQDDFGPAGGGRGDDGQRWGAGGQAWAGPTGTRPLRLPGPDERGYPGQLSFESERGYPGAGPGAGASAGPPGSGSRPGSRVPRRVMLAALGAVLIGSAGGVAATASAKPPATGGQRRPEAGESPAAGRAGSHRAHPRQPGRGAPMQPEYYINGGPKVVALTIDDGPSPIYTPQILQVLERYHVTALFSMVGQQVASYPQIAREVTDAGHVIANHTWSHPDMAALHAAAMRDEVTRASSQIQAATGQQPTMFRAPFGAWSHALLDYLAAQGLTPLGWSVDPRDWARPGVNSIVANILRTTRTGSIILEHDGGGNRAQTVAALKIVLPRLLDAGFQFRPPNPAAAAVTSHP